MFLMFFMLQTYFSTHSFSPFFQKKIILFIHDIKILFLLLLFLPFIIPLFIQQYEFIILFCLKFKVVKTWMDLMQCYSLQDNFVGLELGF
jgi:hypothetical protein